MTVEELRRRITAVPFVPFTLHVSDGRAIPVHARDFILLSPLGSLVHVYQPNEALDVLDMEHITGVGVPPVKPPAPNPADTNA